jgi:hypothetical protein
MYFCPNCNYTLDISKSFGGENINEKVSIKKLTDAIKLFESDENINFENYKAEFKPEELEKNTKFKKLSQENKNKFNILFQLNNIINAEFKCNNCNYTKEITESIILYEYDVFDKINKITNIEENELYCKNPILPRTRDYICKNISCSTINNKKNKEAVFFRDINSYKINYICCVCYHNW